MGKKIVTAKELGFKDGEATVYEELHYCDITAQIKKVGERAVGTAYVLGKRLKELEVFATKYQNQKWAKENFEKECLWNANHFATGTAAYAIEMPTFDEIIVEGRKDIFGTRNEDDIAVPDNAYALIQHNSTALASATRETRDNSLDSIHRNFYDKNVLSGENIRLYVGGVFKKLKKDKLLNKALTEQQIVGDDKIHPILLGYADDDSDLIKKLVPLTFKAMRDVYGNYEGMGIIFPDMEDFRVPGRAVLKTAVLAPLANSALIIAVDGRYFSDARLVGLTHQKEVMNDVVHDALVEGKEE